MNDDLVCVLISVNDRVFCVSGADWMDELGTQSEVHLVKLFSEVCGIDKVGMLVPRFPVTDIYGNSRFIDFAIRTTFFRVAFEIDGLTWHHPAAITIEKFEDDLL